MAGPEGGLVVDAAGNLYGTTFSVATNSYGTVYEVAAGTHALSTLATFDGVANGSGPLGGLTADADGNLYGTTYNRGPSGYGTVYEVAGGTHVLSTLAAFNNSNGANSQAGLIADAAGNLYGTTSYGGVNGVGTVFQVAAGTHALSTLVTFNGSNGSNPLGRLTADAAGNLYGTTQAGGANSYGTVFQVAAGTRALSTLATFNNSNGGLPQGTLITDSSGNLYGTAYQGGANNFGTVFEIAAGTHAVTTLATFNNSNGANPYTGLTIDAAGNLYGTTAYGGANNDGTLFKIAAGTHALSTLATFDGSNGSHPLSSLVADSAGNLYGTAHVGGPNNDGTVFELTNTGFVTFAPEPAAASLIGLTGLGLLARQRRSCKA